MSGVNAFLTQSLICLLSLAGHELVARAQQALPALSEAAAVELAESFVRENGYTDAPEAEVKARLDSEGIEWSKNRGDLLRNRRNTLQSRAIGIKRTNDGWGVAFAYVTNSGTCRVVTMAADGSRIRMQHQDGILNYWRGFGSR
jgi:hypothetical protein